MDVTIAAAAAPPESRRRIELGLEGMTCAACAARIEKALQPHSRRRGQRQFRHRDRVGRARRRASSPEQLLAAVERAGYHAVVRRDADGRTRSRSRAQGGGVRRAAARVLDCRRADAAAARADDSDARCRRLAGQCGRHAEWLPRWLQLALATPVQFWIGRRFYVGAWHALRGGGANMDVLIALGTTMAWGLSAVVTLARPRARSTSTSRRAPR